MVRTRVIQTLFAYYQLDGKGTHGARQELLKSFSDTYNLYMLLLEFVNALTDYAEGQMADACARARATHTIFTPNKRFLENRFAAQVFRNKTLRKYVEEQHLSWESGYNAVSATYKALLESDFYKEYMSQETVTYEDDKRIWRRIFTDILPAQAELESALDEMEITLDSTCWTTDADVVLSYVVKTIKRFNEENDADQPLLEMFDKEDELKFAEDLLRYAIEGHEKFDQLIFAHLKNWDADRIAYMDRVILETALAEILNFPEIALQITMNEYLEIAKEYSGEKSYIFINGILDEIVKELRKSGEIVKC